MRKPRAPVIERHIDYTRTSTRLFIEIVYGADIPATADRETRLRIYFSQMDRFIQEVTKPWRDELMTIINSKPPQPIFIPMDDAARARMDTYIAEHHPTLWAKL